MMTSMREQTAHAGDDQVPLVVDRDDDGEGQGMGAGLLGGGQRSQQFERLRTFNGGRFSAKQGRGSLSPWDSLNYRPHRNPMRAR